MNVRPIRRGPGPLPRLLPAPRLGAAKSLPDWFSFAIVSRAIGGERSNGGGVDTPRLPQ